MTENISPHDNNTEAGMQTSFEAIRALTKEATKKQPKHPSATHLPPHRTPQQKESMSTVLQEKATNL